MIGMRIEYQDHSIKDRGKNPGNCNLGSRSRLRIRIGIKDRRSDQDQ
jgi:hypothetical protein